MNQFTFSEKIRSALECQQHPFAVFRYVENSVVTVLVSDGFCDLFGYTDREQAVWDMDHDMYRDTHPDDRQRKLLYNLQQVMIMLSMMSFSGQRQVWIRIIM